MNQKRTIILLILLTGMLFLTACKEDKKETTAAEYVIGFSQCNSAEPWREAMNKAMQSESDKYPEYELVISDAQQSNSKQVADVENFIVQEVDVLIISPNEAKPLTAIVGKAYREGIPVIVLDRKILSDEYTVYIGANNEKIGEQAGRYAAQLLNGKGKVIEIWGLKGSTPAIERHDGFMKGVAGYPEIKVIYEQDGAWLRRKGREIMENALQRFETIDLVYAHNDPMAIGAFLAAQYAGRQEDMFFIGIDGLPGPEGGAQAVLDGQLDATFLYPTGGREAIRVADDIIDGRKVPKHITLGTERIDPSNAQKYK
ncbi:MAG: substrate-binding domain-containing protein [Caldithrix sp.]|nr:substrate-binding domain-containing protein [Caldithrix sp.]